MSRKSFWVGVACALILFGIAGGAVFAQKITVNIPGKVDIETAQYEFHAQMINIKEGFQLGVSRSGKTPFVNLDMYLKAKIQVGAKPLPQFSMPEITVVIPLDYITKVTKLKNGDDILKNLSFWDPDPKNPKWIPAAQLVKDGEITAPTISEGNLIFNALKWPLDDRMIGC
ncbi:MAG: hypothetical protein ABSF77_04205 [Spirochaetia bacterium]